MGLLNWLKGKKTPTQETHPVQKTPSSPPLRPSERCIIPIKNPRFKEVKRISIRPSDPLSLEDIFTSGKVNDTLPGFTFKSKKKAKLISSTDQNFTLCASNSLNCLCQNRGAQFSLKESIFNCANVIEANRRGALLRSENTVGYLDYRSGILHLYQFAWHPFRTAMNESRWFVGTRETADGPGELYCFSFRGEYLWGLQCTEEFVQFDRIIKATPYSLFTTEKSSDIIVSTMDKFYHLSPDGTLLTRIALSDLRETDIKEKKSRREALRPKDPKTKEEIIHTLATDIVEGFNFGIESATINSPCAGYTYDPQTETLFVLEVEGRLTAWDTAGTLLWTHLFNERGGFITLIKDYVVISLWSGALFWIDLDGEVSSSVKMPAHAVSVTPIPDTGRYLVICENKRRYELDRHTSEVIEGPEGNRNMRVFKYQERLFFYDDGYLWATPKGQGWQRYELKLAENATHVSDLSNDSSPSPIRANKPFKEVWRLVNPGKRPFDHFAVDKTNRRIYVGRSKFDLTDQEKTQQEASLENHFAYWHEILCYDFSLNTIWSKSYLSDLTCLTISPEGDAVFVGVWGKGLAYDPAGLIILNSEGHEYARFATPANPLSIEFEGVDSGILTDYNRTRTVLTRVCPGEWILQSSVETGDMSQGEDYGAGIGRATRGSFSLRRTGKKMYEVTSQKTVFELKVNAAIYEVLAIPRSGNLLLRVGNKNLRMLSPDGETVWKLKTKKNVREIVPDGEGFLLLVKDEVAYVSREGTVLWRAGCPPHSVLNKAQWLQSQNAYLWYAGDSYHFQVNLITLQGMVVRSQMFEGVSEYHGREIGVTDDSFVMLIDDATLCCFG